MGIKLIERGRPSDSLSSSAYYSDSSGKLCILEVSFTVQDTLVGNSIKKVNKGLKTLSLKAPAEWAERFFEYAKTSYKGCEQYSFEGSYFLSKGVRAYIDRPGKYFNTGIPKATVVITGNFFEK
jgi:hypothetical protein